MGRGDSPLEHSILLQKLIEIRHEFIYGLPHVQMPHIRPHRIRITERSRHVFVGAYARLEFIPEAN